MAAPKLLLESSMYIYPVNKMIRLVKKTHTQGSDGALLNAGSLTKIKSTIEFVKDRLLLYYVALLARERECMISASSCG